MTRLHSDFDGDPIVLGARFDHPSARIFAPTVRHLWQAMAVYVWIVGKQNQPIEVRKNENAVAVAVKAARVYLEEKTGLKTPANEYICRILTKYLMGPEYTDELSKNWMSIVAKLGQSIAGDEKLFYFTGVSGNVRLCNSKPGKYGLWFYELCYKVRIRGKEYPLLGHCCMHSSQLETVTVDSIVKKWVEAVWSVAAEEVAEGVNPSPKTFLCFDSYYQSSATRNFLLEIGQKFSCSCSKDRVALEVARIHSAGITDVMGESRSIFNPESKELFTYHYDTQKGVGKKYNLSFGLKRETSKRLVKSHDGIIPGYSFYKTWFEACDNFNRKLHDRCWPHRRGGGNATGETGKHNDFLMAATLENTMTAFCWATDKNPENEIFEHQMCELARQIFVYSFE
jgi:hypothetical protein